MGLEVVVTTENGEVIVGMLDDLDERVINLRPVMRDIALQIYSEEWQIFEQDGAYRGRTAWPALDPDYAKQKAKVVPAKQRGARAGRKGSTKRGIGDALKEAEASLSVGKRADLGILELSGRLRLSLTSPNSPDSILQITNTGLYLGSKRLVGGEERTGGGGGLGFRERFRTTRNSNVYALGFLHAASDIPLRARVPQRESLTVVDEQVAEWADIITQHLEGGQA